ncbi:Mediator of RNA polymerase II transcription subunit 9 [Armadillidium nasatum]|uniref:Mediator of RNA polymerase II transcription subunit 9 n=1 Tax=Armadillidium nasatum TaxID=96803 RepID=A0A5N5T6E8_9CRUS|nr:Mediator of RNA polymerase II transcription subunit 9 [Armadillidium nasatum]
MQVTVQKKHKHNKHRVIVQRLPGVEYSKEEQLQRLEALRKQLSLKKKLLLKYKSKAQPEQSH